MKPSNFKTARIRRPLPPPDPFTFLDRLPRDLWEFATRRFHLGCRHVYANPAEVLAWTRRNIQSTLRDLEGLPRAHPLWAENWEALQALDQALASYPEEARAFARHIIGVEVLIQMQIDLGAKDANLRGKGGAR